MALFSNILGGGRQAASLSASSYKRNFGFFSRAFGGTPPATTYIIATGGIAYRDGDYIYRVFNSSDNFVVTQLSNDPLLNGIEYLVVAGGGGGGARGGGGGGGFLTSTVAATLNTFPVVIGSGGSGGVFATKGTNGSNSTVFGLTAYGGGAGGVVDNAGSVNLNGNNGGSGGGASVSYTATAGTAGNGTSGQGNNGGAPYTGSNPYGGGGGGGKGAVGANGDSLRGGNGGVGLQSSITGSATYYAGGGGGGSNSFGLASNGGLGGGGGGTNSATAGGNGTANLGGGGGGSGSGTGGNGGSGVVIVRYYSPVIGNIVASGGTIYRDGNYLYHVFNSSDNFVVTQVASNPVDNNIDILLVVGGGGGGGWGGRGSGGGGAAKYIAGHPLSSGVGTYPVIIGSGGAGGSFGTAGTNGGNTTFDGVIGVGSGGGGGSGVGGNGSSGGGGNPTGGTGVAGWGYSGGGYASVCGGGGGGAASAGVNGGSAAGSSNGGNGLLCSITGTAVYYGGGGGGSCDATNKGIGGVGGGGKGADGTNAAVAGTANTGGGGGGANGVAPNGGSGVFIVRYYSPLPEPFDPDAVIIINNMKIAGSTPTESFQLVINKFVKNLKGTGTQGSDNIWALIDYLAAFATETEIQSLVAWKGNNPTKYNSPTYVAKSGWIPASTGSHSLWSNFTPSTNGVNYTQNSCSFGVWLGANPGASYFMASLGTHKSGVRTVSTNNDNYCNSSSFALANFSSMTEGLFWINRASSSAFKTIKNDTVISSPSSTSSGLPTWNMAVAGYANASNTIASIPSLTNPIKLAFAGGNLEPYKTQWYNSVLQYITEVAAL